MDRRRTQTLYMVTRVSLQVVARPVHPARRLRSADNLGTFLGLAGAGLTVALKDFIVGFLGWFVLMGKNGIRIGDLVEINGVTGEVVELGIFYTVLLETGSWSESGHPTGRRVTFTNGFAIEGHYFNFSTSGRWLWDEVRIVVPAGHDPYPIVDAIQKEIDEATADSARQAEAEWTGSRTVAAARGAQRGAGDQPQAGRRAASRSSPATSRASASARSCAPRSIISPSKCSASRRSAPASSPTEPTGKESRI